MLKCVFANNVLHYCGSSQFTQWYMDEQGPSVDHRCQLFWRNEAFRRIISMNKIERFFMRNMEVHCFLVIMEHPIYWFIQGALLSFIQSGAPYF